MAKQSGLGDNLYVGGFDISGDVGSIDTIGGGPAALDVTGINKSANERIGGERDGSMSFTAFWNPGLTPAEHVVLSTLPTADVQLMYERGAILGNPSAVLVGKQINYDGTRGSDGAFTFKVDAQGDGFGLEWGVQLTAGVRTDVAATNGVGVDQTTVSTALGWQAYLQVFGFTGTDATIKIQDSADNSTFADLAGGAFTQVTTSTPQGQRLQGGATAVVRRYVRAITITTGGFTSLPFAVMFNRNLTATVF